MLNIRQKRDFKLKWPNASFSRRNLVNERNYYKTNRAEARVPTFFPSLLHCIKPYLAAYLQMPSPSDEDKREEL